MRSPEDSSMSISRGWGASEISSAIAISSSVVLPRAESTATTSLPSPRLSTIRRAARFTRSAFATEVPPNFITTSPGIRRGLHSPPPGESLAERDLVGVLEIGADRQAAGQPRDDQLRGAGSQLLCDVQCGGFAGCRRV